MLFLFDIFKKLHFQALVLNTLHESSGGRHFCKCLDKGSDTQRDERSQRPTTFNYIVCVILTVLITFHFVA